LEWLRRNELPSGGIRAFSGSSKAYPEVTGYLIPTLMKAGECDLALRLSEWLVRIQREEGAFLGLDGRAYVFDTGQALRGLLAGLVLKPALRDSMRKAVEYLTSQLLDDGNGGFIRQYAHMPVHESILLYALVPMVEACEVLGMEQSAGAAARAVDHYAKSATVLDTGALTHFLAYEIEALIDLGREDQAAPTLEQLKEAQDSAGAVTATVRDRWVCVPGLAQLALCWHKVGDRRPAENAMEWLQAHQLRNGGFLGSVGRGATYYPASELSWAAKFFLDASYQSERAALGSAPGSHEERPFPAEGASHHYGCARLTPRLIP